MPRALLLFFLLLSANALFAQRITLHHLMRIHSQDAGTASEELRQDGWRYLGVQHNELRKPRLYITGSEPGNQTRLYVYSYRRKPLSKVELVSANVQAFNSSIRDSLAAYGFVPELEHPVPDEEDLKITASAYFINRDALVPVHALILYYQERRTQKVSLTIYEDE